MEGRLTRRGIDGLLIALAAGAAALAQADLDGPPRYDGAGYAVLAESLLEGAGYRAIDHPDEPRHAHFPPGYPVFLALLCKAAGPADRVVHLASIACTVGATLAAWRWFRTMYARPASFALGLALAANWAWARAGSGFQSEPLYALLGWTGVWLAAAKPGAREARRGVLIGSALGAATLTRQVGLVLAAAVFLEMYARGRWRTLMAASLALAVLFVPWVVWSAMVGLEGAGRTQAGLLFRAGHGIAATVPDQLLFYIGRIPDALTAPVVEVVTVFGGTPRLRGAAVVWSFAATAVVLVGLFATLKDPRRRLAGLIGLGTLALLIAWPYTEAGRFLIPLIPALLVGAVEGLSRAGRLLGLRSRFGRRWSSRLLLLAALPYSAYAAATADRRIEASRTPAFNAACDWLLDRADRIGPVLTRHPGEVYLLTSRKAVEVETSERPGSTDAAPDAVAEAIRRYGIVYLLVDSDRYARAVASPLERYVHERPQRVREVFHAELGGSLVRVFEVVEPD
ncbi:glycosyltransferase family protein [Paludisphaera rhizosphaerae]|uniref:glycosyltransferase family 39 protein n=1 Tax=Paludisphaera rhizosphaerae TaxID=2711216 RepID=UPI0013ECC740|nr:glycosyltransferase family 39 protein [Paludisphaera rhizosphaerae]